ncbi:MAG: hypothetical protein LBT12_04145 [Oscillospiraceae bacterium]|nr:hypothetical protein [Oscillospiraceae bacterium]
MKHAALCVLLLFFLLPGCARDAQSAPTASPSAEPVSPSVSAPPPAYDPAFRLPERIDLRFPPPPEPYAPEAEVIPLVNGRDVYKSGVFGETLFLNRQLEILDLPEGTDNYYIVRDGSVLTNDRAAPVAAALINAAGNIAFMRLDGAVMTDFVYRDYSQGDGYDIRSVGGYIQVCREDAGFGLLDIRTGEEVVPCGFEELILLDGYLLADSRFLDFSGNVLYDCESKAVTLIMPGDPVRFYDHAAYALELETSALYSADYADNTTVELYERRLVVADDWTANPREVKIFDLDGNLLFGGLAGNVFYRNGHLILPGEGTAVVVTAGGETLELPLPEKTESGYGDAVYIDGRLVFEDAAPVADGAPDGVDYRKDAGAFTITARYKEPGGAWWSGVAYLAIASGGEILMENPYGVIEELTFPDAIAVYADESSCLLLYTDGHTVPIPNAPKVKYEHIGG